MRNQRNGTKTTTQPTQRIQKDKTYTHKTMGLVTVLAVDSDPTCMVWVFSNANVDLGAMVEPTDLS